MDSNSLREIELWCGLAAAVLGILIPLYGVIFVTPPNGEIGSIVLVILGLDLAVAVGAMIDSQARSIRAASGGLALLWAATVPLIGLIFLPFGNLGLYMLPAAILALISALAGSYASYTSRSGAT